MVHVISHRVVQVTNLVWHNAPPAKNIYHQWEITLSRGISAYGIVYLLVLPLVQKCFKKTGLSRVPDSTRHFIGIKHLTWNYPKASSIFIAVSKELKDVPSISYLRSEWSPDKPKYKNPKLKTLCKPSRLRNHHLHYYPRTRPMVEFRSALGYSKWKIIEIYIIFPMPNHHKPPNNSPTWMHVRKNKQHRNMCTHMCIYICAYTYVHMHVHTYI